MSFAVASKLPALESASVVRMRIAKNKGERNLPVQTQSTVGIIRGATPPPAGSVGPCCMALSVVCVVFVLYKPVEQLTGE